MNNNEAIDQCLLRLASPISVREKEDLREQLITCVNFLLLNDFNALVQLLYRVDVDEERLKLLLKQNPQQDAALLITTLLIERQAEKAAARSRRENGGPISEDEKW